MNKKLVIVRNRKISLVIKNGGDKKLTVIDEKTYYGMEELLGKEENEGMSKYLDIRFIPSGPIIMGEPGTGLYSDLPGAMNIDEEQVKKQRKKYDKEPNSYDSSYIKELVEDMYKNIESASHMPKLYPEP